MPTTVIIGSIALGCSVPLLWWSVASGRVARPGVTRRGQGTADLRELALAEAASTRVVNPAMRGLFRALRRITPAGWIEAVDKRLRLAAIDERWPAERVVVLQVLIVAGAVALGIVAMRRATPAVGLLSLLVMAWLSSVMPLVFLDRLVRTRQAAIQRGLPDALDQITMSVEAGLAFEAALKRAAEAGDGPLAEEMTRTLAEMQMGVTRSGALRALADRTQIPDLQTFVIAVVQAEENGLPIAKVLRVQAAELRQKRRQRAEEKAMRLPVKMIFPLGLCIFPALFIVLIGPGVIRIWRVIIP